MKPDRYMPSRAASVLPGPPSRPGPRAGARGALAALAALMARVTVLPLAGMVLALTLFPAAGPRAELVDDIYQARLAVQDRGRSSLSAARRAGLAEVVVKASGEGLAAENPTVEAALGQSDRYLLGYSYEEDRERGRSGRATLFLRLEYDSTSVQQLLREAGLPLWTANRPPTLAWLVISEGARRRFSSPEAAPAELAALRNSFRTRGLPFQAPLYDLQDAAALSPGEAWRQSSAALVAASRRYRGTELLAGRVARLSDGDWAGDWRYLDNGVWLSRSVSAKTFEEFTDAGADLVASTLASRYAVTLADDADQRHRLVLRGVRAYADFIALQEALASLEAVSRVVPEQIVGDQVSLRIEAEADLVQLSRIIELDTRFVPLPADREDGGLRYEWIQ